MLMLQDKEVIDDDYDKKTLDDSINKVFSLFDKTMTGIVALEDIALGCSCLCKGSIGDKIKILFQIMDIDMDGKISYEELSTYFEVVFTICLQGKVEMVSPSSPSGIRHQCQETG